jgi:hypothetical protein
MNVLKHIRTYLLMCSLMVNLQTLQGFAQPTPPTAERDGQHDFDFEIGAWKIHVTRLQHPLTGSTTSVEYDGTLVVRKVWNGRSSLAELEVDGPTGHLEFLSLRLYDPQAHQWSLNNASSRAGTLNVPTIGEFKNGRGEFYDMEPFNGRSILVRNGWSDITADSWRFEQSYSEDGGKTWEVNWAETARRVKDDADQAHWTMHATMQG